MTPEEKIRANCELVIKTMQKDLGINLSYDEKSVAWLEGYIERNRHVEPTTINQLVNVFGSFLEECMCHEFDGKWEEVDGNWKISITSPKSTFYANPFGKVEKQYKNGIKSGESILSFFRTTRIMHEKWID